MDTPFDQTVPLPPEFRRSRQEVNDRRAPKPGFLSSVFPSIAVLCSALVIYFAYSLHGGGVATNIDRLMGSQLRHGIANDVEEARIYVERLQQKLELSNTNSTIPSIVGVMNQTTATVSAATYFLSCHDKFTLDLERVARSDGDCFTLFEHALDCHAHLVKFHKHHKTVAAACKVSVVGELREEIGRMERWEQQRAESTLDKASSVSALLGEWKQMFSWHHNREVLQDEGDYQQGRRVALVKRELERDIERVGGLRLLNLDKDGCRQRLSDRYDGVISHFTDAGCRAPGVPCMCQGIDFESMRRALEQVAFEMTQLAYGLASKEV